MGFKDKMLAMTNKGAELAKKGADAARDSANTIKFIDVQGTFEGKSASILLGGDSMVLTIGESAFYTIPDDLTNIEFEYFEEEGRSTSSTLGKGALGLASFAMAQSALGSVDNRDGVQSVTNKSAVAGLLGGAAAKMDSSEMKGYMAIFMEFKDQSMFSARLPIKYWEGFKFDYDAYNFQVFKTETEGTMQKICDEVVQLQNSMKELGAKEKMEMLKVITKRNRNVEVIQQRLNEIKSFAEQRGVDVT